MSAQILDGKALAKTIRQELKSDVAALSEHDVSPGLSVILVGDDPASAVYVNSKAKMCKRVGIRSSMHILPESTPQDQLLALIDTLNADNGCDGILVQLPLPSQIESELVLRRVSPEKDVDGFHPINVGLLSIGEPRFAPCTPAGLIEMLDRAGIAIKGKRAVVVGRSNIVGKPIAMLLLHRHATVTICHSRTDDLPAVCRDADILVAAVGRPELIKESWVKPGAVILDVGINRLDDGRLVGDVDFASVSPVAGHITPVPGGVGPMTIAMLLKNTVRAARLRRGLPT